MEDAENCSKNSVNSSTLSAVVSTVSLNQGKETSGDIFTKGDDVSLVSINTYFYFKPSLFSR